MTSLWLLGLNANTRVEERVLEWLLPAVACVFVFGSIPRQMKNFFASGLLFFAIGVYRLQQNVFPNHAGWPVFLLATGLGPDGGRRQLRSVESGVEPVVTDQEAVFRPDAVGNLGGQRG
jgi:hypothetical protein